MLSLFGKSAKGKHKEVTEASCRGGNAFLFAKNEEKKALKSY